MGTGSNDTENLGQPADMAVYPRTNEVFVADGYGNRRVIVFDAEPARTSGTGARMATGPMMPRPNDGQSRTLAIRSSTRSITCASRRMARLRGGPAEPAHPGIPDRRDVRERSVRPSRQRRKTPGRYPRWPSLADRTARFLYVGRSDRKRDSDLDRQTLQEPAPWDASAGTPGSSYRRTTSRLIPRAICIVAEDLGGQRVQKFAIKGVVGTPQR